MKYHDWKQQIECKQCDSSASISEHNKNENKNQTNTPNFNVSNIHLHFNFTTLFKGEITLTSPRVYVNILYLPSVFSKSSNIPCRHTPSTFRLNQKSWECFFSFWLFLLFVTTIMDSWDWDKSYISANENALQNNDSHNK